MRHETTKTPPVFSETLFDPTITTICDPSQGRDLANDMINALQYLVDCAYW